MEGVIDIILADTAIQQSWVTFACARGRPVTNYWCIHNVHAKIQQQSWEALLTRTKGSGAMSDALFLISSFVLTQRRLRVSYAWTRGLTVRRGTVLVDRSTNAQ